MWFGCGDDDGTPSDATIPTDGASQDDAEPSGADVGIDGNREDSASPDADSTDAAEPNEDGGDVADAVIPDAGLGVCTGLSDGDSCAEDRICLGESCVASICGDGYINAAAGEECEDGNDVAFDGCEPGSCTYSCHENSDCLDNNACNGAETCTDHVCQNGSAPAEGSTCPLSMGVGGECRGGSCVPVGCGNGLPDFGEDCDDLNTVNGDGCDNDCTFSCSIDRDCYDSDRCNGDEQCEISTHTCQPGTPVDCDDQDPCTEDRCNAMDGVCFHPVRDGDGDGEASVALGECGTDCDDSNPAVFSGAEELCDGIDNNCDGDTDEEAPTWYLDCDGDGFAQQRIGAIQQCDEPAPVEDCLGWTTTPPGLTGTHDCNDARADVHPGQTAYFDVPYRGVSGASYDYDCDGDETPQYGCFFLLIPECTGTGRSCFMSAHSNFVDDSEHGGDNCTMVNFSPPSRTPVPDCGEEGRLSRCNYTIADGCHRQEVSYAQRCR